jgi:2-polyprenyl-3-methyl-5-hydroxy-6-metoxy-1,4-benzoquinol methylase
MSRRGTGTPTYREMIEKVRARGLERLGLMTSWAWADDPKRLAFTLARYKFVAKMLEGRSHALEVGCGDGFGSRVVRQAVARLTAIDTDPQFIETARETMSEQWPVEFRVHDVLAGPVPGRFDALYSLDVLEHIPAESERTFLDHMLAPLEAHGICIVGMPSLQSQAHASPLSVLGHVNCKDQPSLRALLSDYFHHVFLFSMNDEVVHTGYQAMSHYNIALCCERRTS